MDTLAYTHLVSAYEASEKPHDGSLVLLRGLNWSALASKSWLPILSIAVGAAVLSGGNAQAALSHGDSGADVKAVQHKLAYYGYFHARATGYYGKITTHAVKAFQHDYGLHADGIVGPRTAAAMGLSYYKPVSHHKPHYSYKKASHSKCHCGGSYLSKGDRGYSVAKLQNRLADYGYFYANSTGYYGSITKNAVKNFQDDYGLSVDGIAGPSTLRAMGL
ncbi:MAG: peptidoglycan-binding protein [Oscillatoriales cyanobacterium RM1_1_9]|nr:peptidoglycan-binding protein [Oscillatoriales cyanobacterium SM2_3_0]NJO44297.1 peptidoglycan-binding protein [Oscillatoriales cyanobacterium RM2_1_1]NJO70621.1 peptidoglycan-binding protein [Oscillatoriales cyanobacterium RM1_1_9]